MGSFRQQGGNSTYTGRALMEVEVVVVVMMVVEEELVVVEVLLMIVPHMDMIRLWSFKGREYCWCTDLLSWA